MMVVNSGRSHFLSLSLIRFSICAKMGGMQDNPKWPKWPGHVWIFLVLGFISTSAAVYSAYLARQQAIQLQAKPALQTSKAVVATKSASENLSPAPHGTSVSIFPFVLSASSSILMFILLVFVARQYAYILKAAKDRDAAILKVYRGIGGFVNIESDLAILISRAEVIREHLEWLAGQYHSDRTGKSWSVYMTINPSLLSEWARLIQWHGNECKRFAAGLNLSQSKIFGKDFLNYCAGSCQDVGLDDIRMYVQEHRALLTIMRQDYAASFFEPIAGAASSTTS